MRLISWLSLISGLLLIVALTAVSMRAGERDVPKDGFKAAQSITASVLGFERDVACVYGDDFERSESDRKLGQDDGRAHPHWMCDDSKVVVRRTNGNTALLAEELLPRTVGPGTEILVILGLFAAGGFGLFRTRERY